MMQHKPNTWSTTTLKRDCLQCGLDQHHDYAEGRRIRIRRKASVAYFNGNATVYLCYEHAAKHGYKGRT